MVGFAPRSNPQGDGIVLEDKYDIFILCMVPALKMLCEQLTRPFTVPSREVGTVGSCGQSRLNYLFVVLEIESHQTTIAQQRQFLFRAL